MKNLDARRVEILCLFSGWLALVVVLRRNHAQFVHVSPSLFIKSESHSVSIYLKPSEPITSLPNLRGAGNVSEGTVKMIVAITLDFISYVSIFASEVRHRFSALNRSTNVSGLVATVVEWQLHDFRITNDTH